MGGLTSAAGTSFYGVAAQSQGAGIPFAWLNEEGNPNLKSETANTWTAGIVFAQLSENPWLAGFTGSIDWWQVNIQNAIELQDPGQLQLCLLRDRHRHHGSAGAPLRRRPQRRV